MVSAEFYINGSQIGQTYITADDGETVTLQLVDSSGVNKVEYSFIGYFPSTIVLPSIVKSGIPLGSTATFTFPTEPSGYYSEGICLLIKCIVNNGRDANGVKDPNLVFVGAIGSLNSAGFIPFGLGETSQYGSHAVIDRLNAMLKYATQNTALDGAPGTIAFVNDDGYLDTDARIIWNFDDGDLEVNGDLEINGALSGATTIGSSYLTTTANDARFNFGSNDVVIGDGYIKASGISLQTYIGNDSKLILDDSSLYPTINDGIALGISSNRFFSIYSNYLDTNNLSLHGTISGATTIGSTYFTTTANNATFNFGGNDIVIGDGFIKVAGSALQTYIGNNSELTLNGAALYPSTNNGLNSGQASYRWNTVYGTSLDLNGTISGATTIGSSYFTTTANDATFNFGSNDVVIGDGYIKASGSTLQTYIGNTSELTLTSDTLRPSTNGTLTLGDGSYGFLGARFYNPAGCVITLKADTNTNCYINFGDTDSISQGRLLYVNSTDLFIFRVNDTDELVVSSTALYPHANNGLDLGSSSLYWNNAYITTGSFATAANPDTNGGADLGTTSLYWNTTHTNNIKAASNLKFYIGSSNELSLNSSALYPSTSSGLDLGGSTNGFANGYFINSGDCNVSILSGTDDISSIFMGNPTDPDECYFKYFNGSGQLSVAVGASFKLTLTTTSLSPAYHDGLTCGDATNHWSVVYASSGSINTSDERVKQDILPIDGYVLDAWDDVSLVFYRYISSVDEKGDNARIHSGYISQRIRDAFAANGLDAHRYGLFCYDQWEEKLDSEGNIVQKAGDAYGIRLEECLAVEAAYQRRENQLLKDRITRIEKLLNM